VVAQQQGGLALEVTAQVAEVLRVEGRLEVLAPDPLDLVLAVVPEVGDVVRLVAGLDAALEQVIASCELPQVDHHGESDAGARGLASAVLSRGRLLAAARHQGCAAGSPHQRQAGDLEEPSS
jgi:hypothetical protein